VKNKAEARRQNMRMAMTNELKSEGAKNGKSDQVILPPSAQARGST